MRRFLIRVIVFGAIIAACLIIMQASISFTRNRTLRLPENITTVYFGNSTLEAGINDSILDNSFNFARSSERIEFIYCKIRLLTEVNPQIDTIVVGIDDYLLYQPYGAEFHHQLSHPYYLAEYDADDLATLLKNTSFNYLTSYLSHSHSIKKLRLSINSHHPKDLEIGGYVKLDRHKLKEDLERRKAGKPMLRSLDTLNRVPIYFFQKIRDYCKKEDLKFLLISTPKYPTVKSDSVYRQFRRKYLKDVPLYDYSCIALPDSCYGDCTHLNVSGASVFSKYLEENGFGKR